MILKNQCVVFNEYLRGSCEVVSPLFSRFNFWFPVIPEVPTQGVSAPASFSLRALSMEGTRGSKKDSI